MWNSKIVRTLRQSQLRQVPAEGIQSHRAARSPQARRLRKGERPGAVYTMDISPSGNAPRKISDLALSPCPDCIHGHEQGRSAARRPSSAPLRRSRNCRRWPTSAATSPTRYPCFPGIAYFQGEEVGAFVAADTEAIADEALRLIEVEWEERPFVLDAEEGLKPGAPLVNPETYPGGNHYNEGFLDVEQHGDVVKGICRSRQDRRVRMQAAASHLDRAGTPMRRLQMERRKPGNLGQAAASLYQQAGPLFLVRRIPMNRIQVHCPTRVRALEDGARCPGTWEGTTAPASWPRERDGPSNGPSPAERTFTAARWMKVSTGTG